MVLDHSGFFVNVNNVKICLSYIQSFKCTCKRGIGMTEKLIDDMTKEQVLWLNEWLVIDNDEFHNTKNWSHDYTPMEIKKKYLVIRSTYQIIKPKKTFDDFGKALQYCKEKSIKFNERCLHDNQKNKHFFTHKEWLHSWIEMGSPDQEGALRELLE